MKKQTIPFLYILLYLSFQSQGQTVDINSLSFKLGNWNWETKGLLKPGDSHVYSGKGISRVYYTRDSSGIIDDHQIFWEDGTSYSAITYRTFDLKSNSFSVIWAQGNTKESSKIQGNWEGERFVEIEKGEDMYGPWTNRLELYDITENSHRMKLIRHYNNGYKLTLLEYVAVKSE